MTQHEEDAEFAKIEYLQKLETTMGFLNGYGPAAIEEGLEPIAGAMAMSFAYIHRVYHELQNVDAEEFLRREEAEAETEAGD